jgi:hypothetical protein
MMISRALEILIFDQKPEIEISRHSEKEISKLIVIQSQISILTLIERWKLWRMTRGV